MRHETTPTAGNAISCDTKRLRRPEMSFHATRNGSDSRKCHFMRHETASTVGNVISCDTKRLRRPEMSFHATRNGFDGWKCHFVRHDAAQKTISGRPKRAKRGSRPFRVARNEQKVVFGHFGSPETTKKWFSAISGHQKRLKSGSRPFRVTRRGFDGRPRHAARCARCV